MKGRRTAANRSPHGWKRESVPHPVRHALHTPGEALDGATRTAMESRFHHDFRHIRVHRDPQAHEAARAIDAEAFTAGRHIVFGAGRYAPETERGRTILAHELAHSSPAEHPPETLRLGGVNDVEEAHPRPEAAPVVRRWSTAAAAVSSKGTVPSLDEATRLWELLSRATFLTTEGKTRPVPFHYPVSECEARAHVMDQILQREGYFAEKQFAFSEKSSTDVGYAGAVPGYTDPALNVKTPYGDPRPGRKTREATWSVHVAPVVRVKQPDGSIVRMVLDPAITEGPVTVAQWIRRMSPDKFAETTLEKFLAEKESPVPGGSWSGSVTFRAPRSRYSLHHDVGPATDLTARAALTGVAPLAEGNKLRAAVMNVVAWPDATVDDVVAVIAGATDEARTAIKLAAWEHAAIRDRFGIEGVQRIADALAGGLP